MSPWDCPNPQTQTLCDRYGTRLQKMQPEARMHLVNLATSAHLRNLTINEAERTKDIPFESVSAQYDYEQSVNIVKKMTTDQRTVALFVQAIAQTIF